MARSTFKIGYSRIIDSALDRVFLVASVFRAASFQTIGSTKSSFGRSIGFSEFSLQYSSIKNVSRKHANELLWIRCLSRCIVLNFLHPFPGASELDACYRSR